RQRRLCNLCTDPFVVHLGARRCAGITASRERWPARAASARRIAVGGHAVRSVPGPRPTLNLRRSPAVCAPRRRFQADRPTFVEWSAFARWHSCGLHQQMAVGDRGLMWIRKFLRRNRRPEQAGVLLRGIMTLGLFAMPLSALAQETADTPVVGIASLPRDLSPYGLYLRACPGVKGVLIGLAFASFVTWTVWLAKTVEILFGKRRVRVALKVLGRVRSTAEGSERLAVTPADEVRNFMEAA